MPAGAAELFRRPNQQVILTKFGASVVMDVLRTHPLVILGGFLQENPFFVPPDEFLRELHARDGSTPQS